MNKRKILTKPMNGRAFNGIKLLMVFFLMINSLQYPVLAALTEITPIPTYINDSTPDYQFNSDTETGTITYGGSCAGGSLASIDTIGTYITTLNALADGTYNDCTLTISGTTLNITGFTIDTIPPAILFLDDVDVGPTQSDTIDIGVTESNPNITSYKYLYVSAPYTCDGTLERGGASTYTPGVEFMENTEANNENKICAMTTDLAGTSSYQVSANTLNIDATAPIVTISGSATVYVEYGTDFVDDGATWTDNYDGTGFIAAYNSGTIDTGTIGTYIVEYLYIDTSGNTGSDSRTVIVQDTTAPIVTIIGNTGYVELGNEFIDSGATRTDLPTTNSGVILAYTSGTIDTGTLGTYVVEYQYFDGYNTGSATRTVIIQDTTLPIIGTGYISAGNTGTNGSTGYYNGTINIQATAIDTGVGISGATCEYTTGISWAAASYSGGYCYVDGMTPNADISIQFRIQDIVGNLNTGAITSYIYDDTPPTTTNNANSITGNIDVTITLTPVDTGINGTNTYYCIDTTKTCTPTITGKSVAVTGAADSITHKYIRYYSMDGLGNTESVNDSVQINIDKENPYLSGTTTFSSNNATNSGYAKQADTITITFTSHEALGSLPILTYSGGSSSTGTVTNIGGNNYSATYVMKSTDTQGYIRFNVTMVDTVGNTGIVNITGAIIYDNRVPEGITFTNPTVSSYRQNQSGSAYRTISRSTGSEINFGPIALIIEYSINAFGGVYSIISTGTNNDGEFNRTVNSPDTSSAQIRIIATDLAGNSATFTSSQFKVDSTPPTGPIFIYPTGSEYLKGGSEYTVTRSGGYDDNLSGKILRLSTNGGSTWSTLTTLGDASFNYTWIPSTSTDSTTVRLGIYYQDKGGLTSPYVQTTNFTVDSTPPTTITFTDNNSNRRNSNATATGTSTDAHAGLRSTGMLYRTDTAFTGTCDGGTTTPPTFTTDGYRTGYACIMDKAGNIRTGQQSYKIDKTPPLLTMPADIVTNTGTTINIIVTGDISVISGYSRSMISGPTSGTITFSSSTTEDPFVTGSGDGNYVLQVLIKDNTNNAKTGTINFYRNTTAPIITTGRVTNTTSKTPTFTFTGTNSGTLYRSGPCSSSTTTVVSGYNSLTLSTLSNATYSTCYVRIKDSMNNTGPRYNIPSFTVNYTAPSGGLGGGGGGGGGSISTCTASQLVCSNGIRALTTGASCYGGDLGETCGTDVCVDGDYSGDPDDGLCQDPTKVETESGSTSTGKRVTYVSPYSRELTDAYSYAYGIKITTVSKIEWADMTGVLIRSHLSKMMSEYAMKVLGKKPDTTKKCVFTDISNQTEEFKKYAILACQLGLMGLKTDGTPATIFAPNDQVNRAIFGTTLSRALRGDAHNGGQNRYIKHLEALKEKNIMTQIQYPFNRELRGYVMLMMMRADSAITKSNYLKFTPLRGSKIFIPKTTTKTTTTGTQLTAAEIDFIKNINKDYQFSAGYTAGESDAGVKYLQYFLKAKKYYSGTINGMNTTATVEALFQFQLEKGIVKSEEDQGAGYLGPTTREIINPLLQTLLNP